MEFDREGEFEQIMEEIFPMSIPASFVKSIEVKLSNGQNVSLKGEDLIYPLPMNSTMDWDRLSDNFEKIDDVEVQIDIPAIQESVVANVQSILGAHFKDRSSK